MPLHADAKARGRHFGRLDHAVGRRGRHDQPLAQHAHRLMMPAVDGPNVVGADEGSEARARRDRHGVRERGGRAGGVVRQERRRLARNVLNEGPAERHVQHLKATADRQHGQVGSQRAAHEIDLEGVAARLRHVIRRVRRLAVERRVHVVAAGQEQPVDAAQRDVGGFVDRERPRDGARAADRRFIVARLLAGRDGDDRHPAYIRAGTSTPIRSRARVSCART
jgi:hypothetical protein